MNSRLLMSHMELPPGLLPRGDEGVGSRSYAPTHTIAHHGYAGERCIVPVGDRGRSESIANPGPKPGVCISRHSLSLDSWLRRFLLGALQFANQPTCATRS